MRACRERSRWGFIALFRSRDHNRPVTGGHDHDADAWVVSSVHRNSFRVGVQSSKQVDGANFLVHSSKPRTAEMSRNGARHRHRTITAATGVYASTRGLQA